MEKNMKILIVEHEERDIAFLRRPLKRWGHGVEIADSIKHAEKVTNRKGFDLIFLDLHLPDGSGFGLIPKLKRSMGEPSIIAMTDTDTNSRDLELEARRQGVIYYMLKPIDEKAMEAIVRHLSRKKRKLINFKGRVS
jgi:DNA-binding response OmpR family regulator